MREYWRMPDELRSAFQKAVLCVCKVGAFLGCKVRWRGECEVQSGLYTYCIVSPTASQKPAFPTRGFRPWSPTDRPDLLRRGSFLVPWPRPLSP